MATQYAMSVFEAHKLACNGQVKVLVIGPYTIKRAGALVWSQRGDLVNTVLYRTEEEARRAFSAMAVALDATGGLVQ